MSLAALALVWIHVDSFSPPTMVADSQGYVPFDSNTPVTFEQTQIRICMILAMATLVLYDHIITLDIEVERIWTLRRGFPKLLFFASRYVVSPLLMISVIGEAGYPLLHSFCTFDHIFQKVISALSLVIPGLVLLIRVSALYGHCKIILSFLFCLFTCHLAAVIIETIIVTRISTPTPSYEFLPGCSVLVDVGEASLHWGFGWWIPFLCFDGILLIPTLIKAFSFRVHSNSIIGLVARDSVFYFAFIFGCLLTNIIVYSSGTSWPVDIPTEWVACIAVSRMMMNIRGVMFDNTLRTHGIEFSSIIFENRDQAGNSQGAGIEEQSHTGPICV